MARRFLRMGWRGCGAIVVGLAAFASVYHPEFVDKPFRRREFNDVVQHISDGRLRADKNGVVHLPRAEADLTTTGCVYVTRGDRGYFAVYFPRWIGRRHLLSFFDFQGDNWVEGYLFEHSANDETITEYVGPNTAPFWAWPGIIGSRRWWILYRQNLGGGWSYTDPIS